MEILVTTSGGDTVPFVIDPTMIVRSVKAIIASELKKPDSTHSLFFRGTVLPEEKKITECGVLANDILEFRPKGSISLTSSSTSQQQQQSRPTFESIPQHLWKNPAAVQEYIKSQPQILQQLLHTDPTLAEAILSPDPGWLEQIIQTRTQMHKQKEMDKISRTMALNLDPLNPDAQRAIQDEIQQDNIRENMEIAMEHNPEAFGRVIMLYVPAKVNDVPVNAFVDSGAQMTIMSAECAKRCGIMRLVDTRWGGILKGVGTSKSLGRVHATKLTLGSANLSVSLTIAENQSIDFLLGLDQLKRFQACIDLKDNCLRIADQKITFLAEKDLDRSTRDEDQGVDSSKKDVKTTSSSSSSTSSRSTTSSTSSSTSSSSRPSTTSSIPSTSRLLGQTPTPTTTTTKPPTTTTKPPTTAPTPTPQTTVSPWGSSPWNPTPMVPGSTSSPWGSVPTTTTTPTPTSVPTSNPWGVPSSTTTPSTLQQQEQLLRMLFPGFQQPQQQQPIQPQPQPRPQQSQPQPQPQPQPQQQRTVVPTTQTQTTQTTTGSTTQTGVTEANIQTLIRMGHSREESIQALTMVGGNVELAASYLFAVQSGEMFD